MDQEGRSRLYVNVDLYSINISVDLYFSVHVLVHSYTYRYRSLGRDIHTREIATRVWYTIYAWSFLHGTIIRRRRERFVRNKSPYDATVWRHEVHLDYIRRRVHYTRRINISDIREIAAWSSRFHFEIPPPRERSSQLLFRARHVTSRLQRPGFYIIWTVVGLTKMRSRHGDLMKLSLCVAIR